MPFIPHTREDVQVMLAEIGADSIEDLFDEIPAELRAHRLDGVPPGVSEMEMLGLMSARAAVDTTDVCFIGAGCYDHHIPAAVWDLTARGEFMTAYTPYQAEASQGTLQLIYEYQSMMAALTGMDVSNASVYDGASGLGEAALMATRANKKIKSRTVLVAETVHPFYREVAQNIARNQGVEFVTIPVAPNGLVDVSVLGEVGEVIAVVVQQPNFFGLLENVDAITDWAGERGAFLIAVVNPLSLALLKPPGDWGSNGADIVCGDGQPLGIPMASGGPSFGFLCCRDKLVRQMPGRIIGRTEDLEGRPGFTLTLQAREQHIRRGKATSNICTNQGLLVTAATIHMSLMGASGLKQVAERCHTQVKKLVDALVSIPGVEERFSGPFFHERVLNLPRNSKSVVSMLVERGILGGLALGEHYPGMDDAVLVCATEKRTSGEIERYRSVLQDCLGS
ncbi:MAG: aminomethyl-transferring glycine dehydrogenase subunit GcvPA [Gammaproteobacteria bacterium]|nr:aminomethyl-transferring glycine dehydrogenase subunit GcvPA [Gammaproteobacteria bacterium]